MILFEIFVLETQLTHKIYTRVVALLSWECLEVDDSPIVDHENGFVSKMCF